MTAILNNISYNNTLRIEVKIKHAVNMFGVIGFRGTFHSLFTPFSIRVLNLVFIKFSHDLVVLYNWIEKYLLWRFPNREYLPNSKFYIIGCTYFEFFIALFYNEKKIDELCTRTISSTQTIALTSEIVSTDFIKDYIAQENENKSSLMRLLRFPYLLQNCAHVYFKQR